MLIVFCTCPTVEEAGSLADKLVEQRLAACVQILPKMTSVYIWEGVVQKETEHLLIIKSLPEKWDALRSLISQDHSYSVPEIVAMDSDRVSEPYLSWIREALGV